MLNCVFPPSEIERQSHPLSPFPHPTRLIIIKILCHCSATVHGLTNLKMQMSAELRNSSPAHVPRDGRRYFYSWKSVFGTLGDVIMVMAQDVQLMWLRVALWTVTCPPVSASAVVNCSIMLFLVKSKRPPPTVCQPHQRPTDGPNLVVSSSAILPALLAVSFKMESLLGTMMVRRNRVLAVS